MSTADPAHTEPRETAHTEPREVTAAFWDALYRHDWDLIASFFGPESVYLDVPTGPTAAAKGAENIVARLRLGLDPIPGHEHHPGVVVAEGSVVMTEHTEVWTWASGESVALPFVSVQHVVDSTIVMWKDYWNYATLLDAAPREWQERLFSADLSWIHDATGHPLL